MRSCLLPSPRARLTAAKIVWDVLGDDREVMKIIAMFATLLTRLRGQVVIKNLGGGMYQHWSPMYTPSLFPEM